MRRHPFSPAALPWVLVAVAGLAAGCGSGRGASTPDAGGPGDVGGLSIVTASLPPATAGLPYVATLSATGGTGARVWTLPELLPSKLAWLTLDANGNLTGTPTDVTGDALAFTVQVADASHRAQKAVTLAVSCREGDHFACGVQDPRLICLQGTRTCLHGQATACTAAGQQGSEDFSFCGPDCAACDSRRANLCRGGACACGQLAQGCSGDGSSCCGERGSPDAGCFDTLHDPRHCGSCGNDCAAVADLTSKHLVPGCTAPDCSYACQAHFANCAGPGDLAHGCPDDLSTEAANCGGCGQTCSDHNNTPTCAGGACVKQCKPGWDNCGGDIRSQGCDTQISSDVQHCGSCQAACSAAPPGGYATCENFQCTFECTAGQGLQKCGNACVSLNDAAHCGSCSNACTDIQQCVAGACCPLCDSGACCGGHCKVNLVTHMTSCVR